MQVAVEDIERKSADALMAHGAGPWQAAEVARAVARAEETGNIICGLYYLESYCVQLASGRVNGTVEPVVNASRAGAVAVDAGLGFAQPAFARALPKAVEAARACGIASLSVCHSHTCTSLGFFTEQIAAKGLIGIGFTNASAIVAGPGGRKRVVGTNPIAFTLPGEDGPAMHADFSTAAVALGKITMAKAAGESIPLGWAVDSEGRPTTDPDAALQGSLVSAADYKGWALGLLVEFLAAGLTGSVNSVDVMGLKLRDGLPHDLGQFYILIDPAGHANALADRIGRVASEISDDAPVRIPGSRSKARQQITVDADLWAKVGALAAGSSS
ncbi:Ldh family oxidoreductase [Primorskyibacter sp. S87]|uniref:Ldh family oxidoreductase n=1 Tax=Primorskyibacter sp. S87 TaxID=3415126 RepID=UPI003C7A5656